MPTIEIPEIKISKTTLNGYLTTGTILFGGLATAPGIPHWLTATSVTLASLCGVWMLRIGHLMKDADEQSAIVPGQLGVQQVASHEIPNNPSAIPVEKHAD